MREAISAPTEHHQSRLDKTAPFVRDDGVIFAAQMPRRHFRTDPDGNYDPNELLFTFLGRVTHLDRRDVHQVLTPEGHIIPASEEEFDLSTETVPSIVSFFRGSSERWNRIINPSMGGIRGQLVINNHDLPHARGVTRYGLSLLDHYLLDVPDEDKQAAAAAYMLHDIGNGVGRIDHPCHGVRVARKLYPNLKTTDRQAALFDNIILLHDGDDFESILQSWGRIRVDAAIQKLAAFGPAPLGLIIADKAGDVGPSRLPTAKNIPKRDYQNIHRLINLYWQTEHLGFTEDGEGLEMRFVFGRQISKELGEQISKFVEFRPDGSVVRKSAKRIMDTKHTTEPKSRYDHLLSNFWSEYYPRMMFAVMASFAMNPFLKQTRVVMYDAVGRTPSFPNDLFTFNRDTLAADMYRVYTEKVPADKKGKLAYEQFAEFARIERVPEAVPDVIAARQSAGAGVVAL